MLKFADRKKILGDKVYLKSVEGEWIQPKMLTVEKQDELKTLQQRVLKSAGVSVSKLKEIEKIRTGEISEEDIPDSAYETLLDLNVAPSADTVRFYLLHGLGRHSFVNDDEAGSAEVTPQLVEELMAYSDIAIEISSIIQEFNSPLAKTTSGTSETSPSGSTGEANSTKETLSQTEESPQT